MVMPGRQHVFAHHRDRRARIVGAVARHIDDASDAIEAGRVEQRLGELQRARDRGARGAPIGRARDVVGDAVGSLRPVDQPPRHDDLLIERAGPFEIGHRHLGVDAAPQRLHEFARRQRLDIALALELLLLRIHRVGDVDREHELGVDRDRARPVISEAACRRGAAAPPVHAEMPTTPAMATASATTDSRTRMGASSR